MGDYDVPGYRERNAQYDGNYLDNVDTSRKSVPGSNLGTSKVTAGFDVTNTDVAAGGIIAGLSVTVVGEGHPVDVGFKLIGYVTGVVPTYAQATLLCNGSSTLDGMVTFTRTSCVVSGVDGIIEVSFDHPTEPLAAGVEYTWTVNLSSGAGTLTVLADADYPVSLKVTAR